MIEVEKTQWARDFKLILKDAITLKKVQSHYQANAPKVLAVEARMDALLGQSTSVSNHDFF